jgi:hypothetical protein
MPTRYNISHLGEMLRYIVPLLFREGGGSALHFCLGQTLKQKTAGLSPAAFLQLL